jgi:hypothetical protein
MGMSLLEAYRRFTGSSCLLYTGDGGKTCIFNVRTIPQHFTASWLRKQQTSWMLWEYQISPVPLKCWLYWLYHNLSETYPKTSVYHDGRYEDHCLLRCAAIWRLGQQHRRQKPTNICESETLRSGDRGGHKASSFFPLPIDVCSEDLHCFRSWVKRARASIMFII